MSGYMSWNGDKGNHVHEIFTEYLPNKEQTSLQIYGIIKRYDKVE